MADLILFPSVRRTGTIMRMARMMARYNPEGAERALAERLRDSRKSLLRKGISEEVATREVKAFELAVRAQLWGIILRGGDAA
jgi:hypothetical protein